MYSKTNTGKNPKGVPALESFKGRLRIRFRLNGVQKTFYLGLADTPENRLKGEAIVSKMQIELLAGVFDTTLESYKPFSHLSLVPDRQTELDLGELWQKYEQYKKPQVSPSTFASDYSRTRNRIAELPSKSLEQALEIRDYLVANFSPNAAKRAIVDLNACCNWAVDSGLIASNPFLGMPRKLRSPKGKDEEVDINPFTVKERDIIIKAFEASKYYAYYAPLVKFLFFTGCRPSEAVALQWRHIDDRYITFEQAVVSCGGKLTLKEGLKTQSRRRFPINRQVRSILESVKPEEVDPNAYVFPAKEGGFLSVANLLRRAWKGYKSRQIWIDGIVTTLAKQGKISEYKKLYQARHTFISVCLESGVDAKDVARWVGNSPEIIYKHYAGNKRDLQVPNL